MKISAFWIVKNEEENLPRSIESLKDGVDELIVVDTGSTDRTVEIAKEYGARVEYFEWIKDFSAARNYALSFVTGDIILWMDADEWFVPAFGQPEKEKVVRMFQEQNPDILLLQRTDMDTNLGLKMGTIDLWRFWQRKRGLHFEGAIHEVLVSDDGGKVTSLNSGLNIDHSGYNQEMMGDKLARNIELLKKAVEDPGETQMDRAKFRAYLVREYKIRGENELALQQFLAGMRDTNTYKSLPRYQMLQTQFCIAGLDLGRRFRERVSRREFYERLVLGFDKTWGERNESWAMPLFYSASFEPSAEGMLAKIKKVLPMLSESGKQIGESSLLGPLAVLYTRAAEICWQLRRVDEAFSYALEALKVYPEKQQAGALRILLRCMQGQPEADQILLLQSVLDTENQVKMHWLVDALWKMGGTMLCFYFFKKQFEKEWASKKNYFYVQLLQGKQDEMLAGLMDEENDVPMDVVADMLLLALVCGGGAQILEKYADKFGQNRHMAEAFLAGKPMDSIHNDELAWLQNYYDWMMRLSPEGAEAFRALFILRSDMMYYCRVVWCVNNGRYDGLTGDDVDYAQRATILQRNDYVYCLQMDGQHGAALTQLEEMLGEEVMDDGTLSNLWVLAQVAQGEVAERAQALYDAEWAQWNECVDIQDMVNTGIVYDEYQNKGERKLGTLTAAQWKKSMAEQPVSTREKYLETLENAANVCVEQGRLGMAQQYLSRMLANGYRVEDTKAALSAVYEKLGNTAVAVAVERF